MKTAFIYLVMIFLFLTASAQNSDKLIILHTNDLHSRLNGFAPESDYSPLVINNDNTTGGFARIAAVIKQEKDENGPEVLAIDGGDFLMGTLFHSLETKTGFQLQLMEKMGYDVVCLGNHEFDFGPGKIADIINTAKAGGEIPALLLGNVEFNANDPRDDTFEKLFTEKIVRRYTVINVNDLKIGFFSLLGKDAVDVAPLADPLKFLKQASFAKKMVKELNDEGCDIVICLSHSGITRKSGSEWTGEDVDLARSVKGIDLIISGHTHSKLDQPLFVNGIPIVQSGEYGQSVGRIEMILKNGEIAIDNYRLIPVNDKIRGEAEIQQLIDKQKILISTDILEPLGFDYEKSVGESDFILECNEQGDFMESNLGPLIADAIHYYVNKNSAGRSDVSMVAVGVIRDKIIPGVQTAADIFRIMSLGSGSDEVPGYPLSRLYVTGRELKSILEILQVAYRSAPSNYCFYSGIRVDYDPGKGLLKKISKIEIVRPDGRITDVDFSKKNNTLYSVTANSYMLEFIGIIKKMSFGLINVVPKDARGIKVTDMKKSIIDMNDELPGIQEGKEWLALIDFIGSMKDNNGNGIPDIDKKYSSAIRTFFTSGK